MIQKVYASIGESLSKPGITTKDIPDYLNMGINLSLGVGSAVTGIFGVLGGVQYAMSKGDAKAAATARAWITNAVIGFGAVICVFALREFVLDKALGLGGTEQLDTISGVTSF